jgi:hypothetical protein
MAPLIFWHVALCSCDRARTLTTVCLFQQCATRAWELLLAQKKAAALLPIRVTASVKKAGAVLGVSMGKSWEVEITPGLLVSTLGEIANNMLRDFDLARGYGSR